MKKSHKAHMSPQKVVFIKLLVIFTCLALGAALFVMWAKQDTATELAKDVRVAIGLPHPSGALPPAPVAEVVQAVPVVPEVVVEVAKARPLAIELSFQAFVGQPDLWPDTLELTLETSVPILYRDRDFGSMRFVSGQILEVETILASQQVVGSVEGNYLIVPVQKTSLMPWFQDRYRGTYFMRYPGVARVEDTATVDDGRFHVDLLEGMRKWCYRNFGDCTFEITDDALVLRWRPKEDAPIDYRVEARAIAREYLQRQAERGATDNYAPCEIYDLSSGRLLGIGSFYIPSFTAQAYR
jgi:hypothetical protein